MQCRAQRAGFPLTLGLDVPGLPKRSWLKISQVRTLAAERIRRRIARVTPEVLAQAVDGLLEIVGGLTGTPTSGPLADRGPSA